MLSYRHNFRAGNHVDVLKHTVQSLITESLKEKDKSFLYLDTRAGAGRYQLGSEHTEHTGEYPEDIAYIWQQNDLPAKLEAYINMVKHFNRSRQLCYYPGSPLIARQLLREQDNLQLTELHPSDYPSLRFELQKDSRAHVEKTDGLQQLKARPSPVSRRGLILIDPPYKMKIDYQAVVNGVAEGYKRFATGTYTLRYLVVLCQQTKRTIHDLKAAGIRKALQIELAVLPDSDRRDITASGMIVINPPRKLKQQMNNVLPWPHSKPVSAGIGHIIASWVVPE